MWERVERIYWCVDDVLKVYDTLIVREGSYGVQNDVQGLRNLEKQVWKTEYKQEVTIKNWSILSPLLRNHNKWILKQS